MKNVGYPNYFVQTDFDKQVKEGSNQLIWNSC